MLYRGAEDRVGVVYKRGVMKGGFMGELELDYVIIKLKKKSPAEKQENS